MSKIAELRKTRAELKERLANINQQIKNEHARPKTIEDYQAEVERLKQDNKDLNDKMVDLLVQRDNAKLEVRTLTEELQSLRDLILTERPKTWPFPTGYPTGKEPVVPKVQPFWCKTIPATMPLWTI